THRAQDRDENLARRTHEQTRAVVRRPGENVCFRSGRNKIDWTRNRRRGFRNLRRGARGDRHLHHGRSAALGGGGGGRTRPEPLARRTLRDGNSRRQSARRAFIRPIQPALGVYRFSHRIVNDKEFFGCALAAVFILVPLILLIIGLVQLRKLKGAVRNLVQRVAQLEARGVTAAPATPVTEAKKAEPVAPPPAPFVRPVAPPMEPMPPPPPIP